MSPAIHVVILAAGKGTRMKSARPKVLHHVAGRPMIEHVLDVAAAVSPQTTTVVLGHGGEILRAALANRPGLGFVVQEPQLGTAHALLATEPVLRKARGILILLSGDVPLLSADTLRKLAKRHSARHAAATVVTAVVADPHGYGRIVRSGDQLVGIVEEKDASAAERKIREINSGIYAFALDGLFDAVKSIAAANVQREHYLPDLMAVFRKRGRVVDTMTVSNADEIRGVNGRADLADVSRIARQRKNADVMATGGTLEDPATIYIDRHVNIGTDTIVHPHVSLEGRTRIGGGCEIHSGVRIIDSRIGDRVTIFNHCIIRDASVQNDASIGPFAHLRPEVSVGAYAKVGNFVEMKKTRLGRGSKSMHLSYLGDAVIGADVNIGAGTITCNYDGSSKQTTTIEDGVFIGSDTQLIAPVTVGKRAYVGTGTTIRENVPPGALAVSAGKQRNIENWVEKRKSKK